MFIYHLRNHPLIGKIGIYGQTIDIYLRAYPFAAYWKYPINQKISVASLSEILDTIQENLPEQILTEGEQFLQRFIAPLVLQNYLQQGPGISAQDKEQLLQAYKE